MAMSHIKFEKHNDNRIQNDMMARSQVFVPACLSCCVFRIEHKLTQAKLITSATHFSVKKFPTLEMTVSIWSCAVICASSIHTCSPILYARSIDGLVCIKRSILICPAQAVVSFFNLILFVYMHMSEIKNSTLFSSWNRRVCACVIHLHQINKPKRRVHVQCITLCVRVCAYIFSLYYFHFFSILVRWIVEC